MFPSDSEMEVILAAMTETSLRLQRIELGAMHLWIKRYGTEAKSRWFTVQTILSRIIPLGFLRPSPVLGPDAMVEREARRIALFIACGFPTPTVVHRSARALILTDNGPTVASRLKQLRSTDPGGHDDLLVRCACDLGKLHAAGLCHGRPHPRDLTLHDDRIGFLDFEEEPTLVMTLPEAQARDMWMLCLQIAPRALNSADTLDRSLRQWMLSAPPETIAQLARIIRTLRPLLPFAKITHRLIGGADIHRFTLAMTFLCSARFDGE